MPETTNEVKKKPGRPRYKHPGGRPTVMTAETLGKLEQAFAIDATVEEACFYAGINPDTFYEYVKRNPKFAEKIEALRNKPVLKARQTIVASLDDPNRAQWYLSRKRKKEFSERTELTGEDGEPIQLDVTIETTIDKVYGEPDNQSPSG